MLIGDSDQPQLSNFERQKYQVQISRMNEYADEWIWNILWYFCWKIWFILELSIDLNDIYIHHIEFICMRIDPAESQLSIGTKTGPGR